MNQNAKWVGAPTYVMYALSRIRVIGRHAGEHWLSGQLEKTTRESLIYGSRQD